jgi:hypothetical protein
VRIKEMESEIRWILGGEYKKKVRWNKMGQK